MALASIILAAGEGTRMRSKLPKVLHPLAGKPMLWYSIHAVMPLVDYPPVLVVGHGADKIQAVIDTGVDYALQAQQLGTGHAVLMAKQQLVEKADTILVSFGDMPLLSGESLAQLVELHKTSGGPVTMTSFIGREARGFGRVIRNEEGHVIAIVEEAEATPEQLTVCEFNVSGYCFDAKWLWPALEKLPLSPKGEYYLTDVISVAVKEGFTVGSLVLSDPDEAMGVNTRVHLAEAEKVIRKRINERWMLNGVTIVDPETTYIETDVQIGQDTIILPNTHLNGETVIGEDCVIGPDAIVADTRVGNKTHIRASVLEKAQLADEVTIGPYCHLREGAILDEKVHLGNFAEVKESYLGPGTKMGHFSYIGDAKIGSDVNIGAGTITCNFDGLRKNLTIIGDEVFIGSDTMLVAPVTIGDRSITGAGAVVTHDVPPDTLVIGVPAKEVHKREKSEQ